MHALKSGLTQTLQLTLTAQPAAAQVTLGTPIAQLLQTVQSTETTRLGASGPSGASEMGGAASSQNAAKAVQLGLGRPSPQFAVGRPTPKQVSVAFFFHSLFLKLEGGKQRNQLKR